MDLAQQITQLKKEKDAVILVHNYQREEVQKVGDFFGDSLELSQRAVGVPHRMIVFCGVRFMAETAKILSPEKKVLLPRADAGCPMANMITQKQLIALKKQYPNAKAVTYVNSSAAVKSISDVCCTSANAVKIVQNIDANEIIFSPDKNLANYCQRFTDKKIIAHTGYCYVHQTQISLEQVIQTQKQYPHAILVVHPECEPPIIDRADEVLSTSGMLRFAAQSTHNEFIIGTEEGLIDRLRKENPHKRFYSLQTPKICKTMKKTFLKDVYEALQFEQHEIFLSQEIIQDARSSLEKMLQYV